MTTASDTRTELVFILDRSGSMYGLESDTIGGFNRIIAEQRKLPGTVHVTTVLFDDVVETLHDHVDLATVKPLTEEEYFVRGCTALLDAIGMTVKQANARQKKDPAGRPDHTMIVITTDGFENASGTYDFKTVRKMVEKRQKKNGWEFMFLGANMDAIKTAAGIGISAKCAARYMPDSQGTEVLFGAVSQAAACMRMDECMDGALDSVRADYEKRGKGQSA